jgi:hypothetical protein
MGFQTDSDVFAVGHDMERSIDVHVSVEEHLMGRGAA